MRGQRKRGVVLKGHILGGNRLLLLYITKALSLCSCYYYKA